MKKFSTLLISSCLITMIAAPVFAALPLDGLLEKEIQMVKMLLEKLEPYIKAREKEETLATLTFEELYAPLNEEEAAFLKEFQNLDAQELNVKIPFRGMATGEEPLIKIAGQIFYGENGEPHEIGVQYLPQHVYDQYLKMMDAMEKDIGKRLLIESGYRSSAYQLYLFVYYLKNHEYSIRETVGFVALPGYSEHGAPEFQALDFINESGINGEDDPSEFDVLPEYEWLLEHAGEFGFVLSYPKTAQVGITYEPWHWRYVSR